MMKRPTQLDVAQKAGVSRATVSYVLNDHVDGRVPISPETRQRVLDAIDELGYVVDARAQSLRSGATRTLGVLLPIYENPYFWKILSGISSEADANGYSLLLARNPMTPELEQQGLRELAQQRVDGLILMIGFKLLPPPILRQLRKSQRPIVEITSTDSVFDCVHDGYWEAAQELMKYLIGLGHRRIGFVYGVSKLEQGLDRLHPYQAAMQQLGITVDDTLFRQCEPTMEGGYQCALELLRQPKRPTALLVINDLLGMAALRAAVDLGLHVPQDVSIASFDDIPFAGYAVPRLTSVAHEPEATGRRAVQMLRRRLLEPDRPREEMEGNWELMIRESTGPAPRLTD